MKFGTGIGGTLDTKKYTFYFTIYHSISVAGMANSSTRNRSYRSSPNWNREDTVLLNAWIYSPRFSTSVRISTAGFSRGLIDMDTKNSLKVSLTYCISQEVMPSPREMHFHCAGESMN